MQRAVTPQTIVQLGRLGLARRRLPRTRGLAGKTPAFLAAFLLAVIDGRGQETQPPSYRRDVAPILRDYCVGCHNNEDLEGEMSMETFRQLMKGGENGAVIAPGQAQESRLIQVLTGRAKPKMPPKKEPQPSPEQIAVLEAWIAGGAHGPAPEEDLSILGTLMVPEVKAEADVARAITAMDISPDGSLMAVARYRQVELLETHNQRPVRVLGENPGKVTAVHFTRQGDQVVAASGVAGLQGEAILWDVKNGEQVRVFGKKHRDLLYDAELSPDERLLATAGYDRQIVIWNVASGEAVRAIEGHNGAVFDLAFSPDGKILASASADETVKLWRVSDGERLDTLNQPQAEQFSVVFSPDGRFVAAAGADNRIRLWRVVSRETPELNPLLVARFAHDGEIVRLAMSSDGRWLVSSSADRSIKLWTFPDLDQAAVFGPQPDLVVALALDPKGKTFMTGGMDGAIKRFPLRPQTAPMADSEEPVLAIFPSISDEVHKLDEVEPNTTLDQAQPTPLPARISGKIDSPGDVDLFRFEARAGEEWTLEVNAARSKSKLDSRIEVLDDQGRPVERLVLQALRDSWFTFRGKDSETSGDFRLQNWREMELNEYLYANGEVVRLWLYPRGPDSGFKVYPGFGKRHTFFGTTALSHPLGEPCYIVQSFPAGAQPPPNGLPVFRLNYENDDDPNQRWVRDSHLLFTAPKTGGYCARISDVRGFGGPDFAYTLDIRPRRPDFSVKVDGQNPAVSPGSGKEFTLTVQREDGFEGEILVDVSGLPEGFAASAPITIEAGQDSAVGLIYAARDAKPPEGDAAKSSRLTATAIIRGEQVDRPAGSLGEIKLGPPAKVLVEILPDGDSGQARAEPGKPIEFTIAPGETITARVKATRVDFKDRIEFGTDETGRNLAHGVYIDNIGLNGLLIVEDQTERQFFITAAPWAPESSRLFHLRASGDGGQTSRPALLHVLPPKTIAAQ